MIKDFRGQVKVADVQAAFDEITGRINSMIDIYNRAQNVGEIDYTKGSPTLGASDYTLSVGGLKAVLNAYNGSTIGCKVYKVSTDKVIVSDGITIHNYKPYRIKSTIKTKKSSGTVPNVTASSSNSSYSYINLENQNWYRPFILSKTDNKNSERYNANNTVPFEFNKIYRLSSADRYGATGQAYIGRFFFAEYNENLDKVVPLVSLGATSNIRIEQIPHDESGDVITSGTNNNIIPVVSVSSFTSDYEVPDGSTEVYVQKIRENDKIKLIVLGSYTGFTSGGNPLYRKQKYIFSDTNSNDSFTMLMSRCNYIQINGNINSNGIASNELGYYEASQTLDKISAFSDFGSMKYYPLERPAGDAGASTDASQLFFDTASKQLLFKNDMFNGANMTIEYIDAEFNQPEITSNTTFGLFTASDNIGEAYLAASDTDMWSDRDVTSGTGYVNWNLSKQIDLKNISFYFECISKGGIVNVYAEDELVYSFAMDEDEERTYTESVDIDVDNIKVSNIKIEIQRGNGEDTYTTGFSVNNLKLDGTYPTYATVSNGVATPYSSIVKITDLNWESGDTILNSVKGVQLEGLDNVSITNQNRVIKKSGQGGKDAFNNKDSAKFVAYTSGYHHNTRRSPQVDFLGKTLIAYGSEGGDNPYRRHFIAAALSLIFIPRGFDVTDKLTTSNVSRWVYNMTLNK